MMTRRCRHGVALLALLTAVACSHGGRERTAPADPFANLGVGQIPVTGLAGTDALLFPVDAVLFGDSLSKEDRLRLTRYLSDHSPRQTIEARQSTEGYILAKRTEGPGDDALEECFVEL